MSRPRLVATDLDGTLLDDQGAISERTQDVVRRVQELGVPVVVVTARPLRWLDDLWPVLGEQGLAVVSNGAIVYDVAEGRVLELTGIAPAAGLVLADAIRDALPEATFAIECLSGIRRDELFDEPSHVPPGSPVGALAEIWDVPAVKLMVRAPGVPPGDLRRVVIEAVGEEATPTWSGDGLVEISAAGVTKAVALARIAADLGVDAAEVVAFGDMPNDLPMLEWAGTSYAMANADPAVVAAADHLAPANTEDGVATVLAGLFGL